ncbi:MAG TPA: hypothetical protein K8V90_09845 [Romboutsia timonensis]|uniref:Uncharacterized protein n=1 Tax=Romboutsia timonensis TaxID=1776391 RepID=A0A921T0D9_9FIRM|nr:hypothetical protein [Romboutsia timonensis]
MAKQRKMTDEELKQWDELYCYVRDEVLKYDEVSGKKFPKEMILRLKGLHEGKFMANNNIKSLGSYGFDIILMTFKFCKLDIIIAMKNVEIKDETHMINLVMKIVERNINTVVDKLKMKKETERKILNVELNEGTKLNYKKKSREVTNKRLKDLI